MKIQYLILFIFLNIVCSLCTAQHNRPADGVAIKTSINNFFKWYKTNSATIQQSDIVNGPNSIFVIKTVDSMARPAINNAAATKHIAIFKSSNCVSTVFLDTLRNQYKELEKIMEGLEPAPVKKISTDLLAFNFDRLFGDDPEKVLNNYQAGVYYDISLATASVPLVDYTFLVL